MYRVVCIWLHVYGCMYRVVCVGLYVQGCMYRVACTGLHVHYRAMWSYLFVTKMEKYQKENEKEGNV